MYVYIAQERQLCVDVDHIRDRRSGGNALKCLKIAFSRSQQPPILNNWKSSEFTLVFASLSMRAASIELKKM